MNRTTTAVLILLATACAKPDTGKPAASKRGDTGASANSAAPTPASKGAADQPSRDVFTITEAGYGPLNVGMTASDAAAAVGAPAPSTAGLDPQCGYVTIANLPAGMRIMVVHDTVARVEVNSGSTATGMGVRIGDTESRVREAYGSRVTVQPHKYVPKGHYLTVSPIPPTDAGLRLIFETDGTRVTKYRAGRTPEVQQVEGCA